MLQAFRGENIPKKEEEVGFLFYGIRKLIKQRGREPQGTKMMSRVSYPCFFDHIPNRLDCGIVVVSCKVEENTKGSDFPSSK